MSLRENSDGLQCYKGGGGGDHIERTTQRTKMVDRPNPEVQLILIRASTPSPPSCLSPQPPSAICHRVSSSSSLSSPPKPPLSLHFLQLPPSVPHPSSNHTAQLTTPFPSTALAWLMVSIRCDRLYLIITAHTLWFFFPSVTTNTRLQGLTLKMKTVKVQHQ